MVCSSEKPWLGDASLAIIAVFRCLTKSRKGAEELRWAAHADRSLTATFSARSAIGLSIVFGALGQRLKTWAIDGVYLPWY